MNHWRIFHLASLGDTGHGGEETQVILCAENPKVRIPVDLDYIGRLLPVDFRNLTEQATGKDAHSVACPEFRVPALLHPSEFAGENVKPALSSGGC